MQTPDLPLILSQVLLFLPAAVSLVLWLQFLTRSERPFWLSPRTYPLPSAAPILFITAGCLILGGQFFNQGLQPDLLDTLSPEVESKDTFQPERQLVATQLSILKNSVLAIVAVFVIWRLPVDDRRRFGFRGDDLRGQIRHGVQGFFLAFLPVYALVLLILPLKESQEAIHPLLRLLSETNYDWKYLFWPIFAAVIVAPIQEELLFRVLLQEGSVSLGYRLRVAIPSVAVFFCLVHLFPDMIPLFPLAMMFGLVMHFRNSFVAVVVMHMLFNAFNILLTLLGG